MESDILKILISQAEEEAKSIMEETRRESEKILKEGEDTVENEKRLKLEALLRRLSVERARKKGEAFSISKDIVLKKQHGIIDIIFNRANKELESIREDRERYRELLKGLIGECLNGVKGETIEIRANPDDVSIVDELVKRDKAKIIVKPDKDVSSGVIVEIKDRGFVLRNTLEERLKKAREYLLEHLSTILEGDGNP